MSNKRSIELTPTPPLRRVADHHSLSISFNNINSNEETSIHRNLSSTSISIQKLQNNCSNLIHQSETILRKRSISSSSSSINNSLRSYSDSPSINQDDDDRSSNDSTNQRWNLHELVSNIQLRQLIIAESLSLFEDNRRRDLIRLNECKICLEECLIDNLSCCSSSICLKCLYNYLSINIKEGRIRIPCPSCEHILIREEILFFLSFEDPNGEISERYKRYYADINGQRHIKTCPRCCSIKEIDKKFVKGIRWKKALPRKVICDECKFEWCFNCHSPWHQKMNCKQYQNGEKMLQLWAQQIQQNQHNAQKCPRCKVYISRNGGCPHMICSKCQCDFCYNCGKRRFSMKYFGSHESRYSPFGCKYNLYPTKPILRHTLRGLIVSAATLAIPIAAVGILTLLTIGTTIAAPTYGTYRLIKFIRLKREENKHEQVIQNNNQNSDYQRALHASLITFKQENRRREQTTNENYPNSSLDHFHNINLQNDDNDDDSLDDTN